MEGWEVPFGGRPSFLFRWVGGDPADPTWVWARDSGYNGSDDFPSLQYDHWYEWVWHVKWSQYASVGYVEWWIDGRKVVPTPSGKDAYGKPFPSRYPTLWRLSDGSSSGVRFQVGVYRKTKTYPETIYIDGVKVGPTRESVQ
jgi:hypothetical protein